MNTIKAKDLKKLHDLGFALHWLKPNSKMPLEPGWTRGPRKTWDEFKSQYQKSFNVGVRLGLASVVNNKYLAVIDIDVKSTDPRHAKEALDKALELFPESKLSPVVYSGRGNGSMHRYVLLDRPLSGADRKAQSDESALVLMPSVKPSRSEEKNLTKEQIEKGYRMRPAWEVSLLSEGRQVVLPGSVHPDSGKTYEWAAGLPQEFPVLAPGRAMSGALKKKDEPTPVTTRKYALRSVSASSLGLKPDQVAGIEKGDGVTDRSAYILKISMALLTRRVEDDIILSLLTDRGTWLGQAAFDHANTENRQRAAEWVDKYTLVKAKALLNESAFDHEVKEEPGEGGEAKPTPRPKTLAESLGFKLEWQKELDLQKGPADSPPTVRATFKNVKLILANEVGEVLLKRNEFSHEDTYGVDTPWGYEKGRKRSGNYDDALQVKNWLIESEYRVEVSTNMIDEALNYFATENSFHPVKDYLESLTWDGVERIDRALFTYLGARMPKVYQREVSRKFFLALVTRIYEPGAKFDHMPVLEGKQGVGKSTFGRFLVGDEWYMDGLPDFQDKDAALNLQGIWLCELSELATLYRSANEAAKAFITRQTDKIRPPYGQRRQDYKRSTVFLGTTNARDYLTDSTGNRRFWPVEIEACDFAAVKRDRDQLFAEALFMYRNFEEPLYLGGKARIIAEKIQEDRRVEDDSDSMQVRFLEWLNLKEEERAGFDMEKLFLIDLFSRGPFRDFNDTMNNRRNAGLVLRKAGYVKSGDNKHKYWIAKRKR